MAVDVPGSSESDDDDNSKKPNPESDPDSLFDKLRGQDRFHGDGDSWSSQLDLGYGNTASAARKQAAVGHEGAAMDPGKFDRKNNFGTDGVSSKESAQTPELSFGWNGEFSDQRERDIATRLDRPEPDSSPTSGPKPEPDNWGKDW